VPFAGKADDAVFPPGPDSVANGQLLRRTISEVDDDTVEENGVAYSQLNCAKDAIATRDLDTFMIPSAVNLYIPQEIPNLPLRRQWDGNGKT